HYSQSAICPICVQVPNHHPKYAVSTNPHINTWTQIGAIDIRLHSRWRQPGTAGNGRSSRSAAQSRGFMAKSKIVTGQKLTACRPHRPTAGQAPAPPPEKAGEMWKISPAPWANHCPKG